MDVLSDVLGALRLQGSLYFTTEFTKPWGVRVPAFGRVARFHLVVRGLCWVRVVGLAEPIHLETGDLILIPHGAEHVLTDEPNQPCRMVEEVVREAGFTGRGALVYGGEDGGAPTRLVCGHFAFDEALEHPLLAQLPPAVVVLWHQTTRDSPLEDAFRFIAREVQEARPGYEAVVQRLSEVVFVQALRVWAGTTSHEHGMLAALADSRLAGALTAMHEDPATPWTLASLAGRAAMGRSAFAERFREVVGTTPLQYLTQWRIQRAKRLMTDSQLTLEQIAERIGYDSAASFSRVFRKVTGASPRDYRRSARQRAA